MAKVTDRAPFVFDDGGRKAAYKNSRGYTGDCGVRAVAIAAQLPYKQVQRDINKLRKGEVIPGSEYEHSHTTKGIYTNLMHQYMDHLGWTWVPTMKVGQGCKVHLRASELPKGRLIVRLSHHYAAVIDGVLHDTYDSSREGTRCVYGYWTKL